MLVKRIVTGIVGIAVALSVVHVGGVLLAAAVLGLAILAWQEFCRLFQNKEMKLPFKTGVVSVAALIAAAYFGGTEALMYVVPLVVLTSICQMVFSDEQLNAIRMSVFLTGALYVGYFFSFLILLRMISPELVATPFGTLTVGEAAVYWAFIGTWASDTFAYFVGSAIGSHKLCPSVSPGKSQEGALGGLLGSMICMAGFGAMFGFPIIEGVVLGFLVGLVAPLGDLCESAFKRYTGVKDSGSILPGHGGILDRFDSILFVAPLVYLFMKLFML